MVEQNKDGDDDTGYQCNAPYLIIVSLNKGVVTLVRMMALIGEGKKTRLGIKSKIRIGGMNQNFIVLRNDWENLASTSS